MRISQKAIFPMNPLSMVLTLLLQTKSASETVRWFSDSTCLRRRSQAVRCLCLVEEQAHLTHCLSGKLTGSLFSRREVEGCYDSPQSLWRRLVRSSTSWNNRRLSRTRTALYYTRLRRGSLDLDCQSFRWLQTYFKQNNWWRTGRSRSWMGPVHHRREVLARGAWKFQGRDREAKRGGNHGYFESSGES